MLPYSHTQYTWLFYMRQDMTKARHTHVLAWADTYSNSCVQFMNALLSTALQYVFPVACFMSACW